MSLQEALYRAAVDMESAAERHLRDSHRLWVTEASCETPTGMVGSCARYTYYRMKGLPETNPADLSTMRKAAIGNHIESVEIAYAKRANVHYADHVKFKYTHPGDSELVISGEMDEILLCDDILVGNEIKTGSGYSFRSTVFDQITTMGLPRINHLLQTMVYLYFCSSTDDATYRQLFGDHGRINTFWVTYVDRGELDKQVHSVQLSEHGAPIINGYEMWDIQNPDNPLSSVFKGQSRTKLFGYDITINGIMQRYRKVHSWLISGLLPDRDYDYSYSVERIRKMKQTGQLSTYRYNQWESGKIPYLCDYQCSFCSYRNQCMSDDGIKI